MSNVKFRIGSGPLDPGTISFEVNPRALGISTGTISNIYLDGENQRYKLCLNSLMESVNGDGVFLDGEGLHIYTNFNRIVCGDNNNIKIGDSQFAFGDGLKSSYDNQFIIGKYNANNSDSIVEIGNGTSNTNRSNLLRITKDGYVYLKPRSSNGNNTLSVSINNTGLNLDDNNAYALLQPSGLHFNSGTTYSGNGIIFRLNASNATIQGPEFNRLNITIPKGLGGQIDPLIRLGSSAGPEELSYITIQADKLTFVAKGINDISAPTMEIGVDLPTSQDSSKIYFEQKQISLTSNKIQFNCDKNNIVDENGDSLFGNSQIIRNSEEVEVHRGVGVNSTTTLCAFNYEIQNGVIIGYFNIESVSGASLLTIDFSSNGVLSPRLAGMNNVAPYINVSITTGGRDLWIASASTRYLEETGQTRLTLELDSIYSGTSNICIQIIALKGNEIKEG